LEEVDDRGRAQQCTGCDNDHPGKERARGLLYIVGVHYTPPNPSAIPLSLPLFPAYPVMPCPYGPSNHPTPAPHAPLNPPLMLSPVIPPPPRSLLTAAGTARWRWAAARRGAGGTAGAAGGPGAGRTRRGAPLGCNTWREGVGKRGRQWEQGWARRVRSGLFQVVVYRMLEGVCHMMHDWGGVTVGTAAPGGSSATGRALSSSGCKGCRGGAGRRGISRLGISISLI
jgi:hypothetical protein